ncbi:hypothetical protein ES708_02601 [subsurface metagenome]
MSKAIKLEERLYNQLDQLLNGRMVMRRGNGNTV